MGDKADNILKSFGLSQDDLKNYATVKRKFDDHFIKQHNTIYEKARFNQRIQEEGEPADNFIIALYGLVEHCNNGNLQNEMIRDRIVVGIHDRNRSETK